MVIGLAFKIRTSDGTSQLLFLDILWGIPVLDLNE